MVPGISPAADSNGKEAHSPTADNGNGAIGPPTKDPAPTTGAASASGPDEPDTHLQPPLPPLHLSDGEHQKIREAVAGQDADVTFQLKKTKPKHDFMPTVGAQVPSALPVQALPSSLTQQLPMLADYKYMKVKGQIAIVNPMTKKIVDVFPETQG
jgi:hypothetical protein